MSSEKKKPQAQPATAEAATSPPATTLFSSPSTDQEEQDLPQYFDSEPSSQPPSYNKHCGNASSKRNSGPASAASVAAILGPPPEKHKKMSLKDRWKELIHNGGNSGADKPDFGPTHSRTTVNIGQADFLPPKKTNG